MMYTHQLILILSTLLGLIAADDKTVIETRNGKIRGQVLKSFKNNDFYAFEGIPYAAPPVDEQRFKIPTEHQHWMGILNTTKNDKFCTEFVNGNLVGYEDCLYLNIYSPKDISNNGSLPVMLFIHGGAYQNRIPNYFAPNYFMDYGVILVVINYRLGPFGFLSTGDGVIPGNLGLKDQRFAIKWISKNIKKFGGDPNKITLFGQSAGSISVSFHLLLQKNKGLFSGAIMQSGSLLCHHDFEPDVGKYSRQLGKLLNSSFNGDSQELLKMLKQLPTEKIAASALEVTLSVRERTNSVNIKSLINIWLPTIEKEDEPGAIVTSPMHQSFIDGNYLKIPLIIGFNSEEAVLYYNRLLNSINQTALEADEHPEYLIRKKLNIENPTKAGKEIKSIYTDSFAKDSTALLQFWSDDYYTTPTLRLADLIYKETAVYFYQFAYAGSNSNISETDNVGHSSEIPYLFGEKQFSNNNDRSNHKRLLKLWTNFAKYQNPTPEDDRLLIKWPKMSDDFQYLNINQTLTTLKNPRRYNLVKPVLMKYIQKPYYIF